MTLEEFSNTFDTLVNAYSNKPAFGELQDSVDLAFDEYEKSVFLTMAQEELIQNLYNGRNTLYQSFETTEQLRRDLSALTITKVYKESDRITGYIGVSDNSLFFNLPEDLWFITYECVKFADPCLKCMDGNRALVTPVSLDAYYKVNENPFRRANKKRVLRLDITDNTVELISKYNIGEYLVRYLERPKPILLIDVEEGLAINGQTEKTECKLNSAIHREILNRAVQLAVGSRTTSTK